VSRNKLTEYPSRLLHRIRQNPEITIMLTIMVSVALIFVISFSMLVHEFNDEVKNCGGARQVIVDIGKEVKSVLDDINKEELKEEVRR